MARRILVLGHPRAQILDLAGPIEVFARTARWLCETGATTKPVYDVELVAAVSGPLTTTSGVPLLVSRSFSEVRGAIDTLIVGGGLGTAAALGDRALLRWVKRAAQRARRVASVCTGAFLLAEAGLLDGRRATTHWSACSKLAERYPRVSVDADPIFVKSGRVYTSAGVTAGMDLALALVEEDHGREVALAVARELVLFLKRPGGQAQFSAALGVQSAEREPLRELQSFIVEHPQADLSIPALARRAAMSTRNFARVFRAELGLTPARYVERVRVEAARRKLEESSAGIEQIADGCGFGSAEIMRRAFLREIRVSPSSYRGRFRSLPRPHA
jgi:transcriptional regulator GlxA family with amidase domain